MSKGRTAAVVAGVVVGAVALIAGAAVVAFVLLSGRGPQPEMAMPADTIAFARIDLDPSAGQKVNALRFLRDNLPQDSDVSVDPESEDPIGEALAASGLFDGVDFGWSDIDAWAGDRAALALIPGPRGGANAAAFVRVDDEAALAAFFDRHAPDAAYAMVREGYAVFAEDEEIVASVVGATSWLADDPAFRNDMDALGGGQILVAWADVASAVDAQESLGDLAGTDLSAAEVSDVTGTVAMGLTVEPDVLELLAVSNGISVDGDTLPWMPSSGDLGTLPSDVVAAVSMGNPGQYLDGILALDALAEQLPDVEDQIASQLGVSLDDVISVLSTTTTVFAAEAPGGFDEAPLVGVRMQEGEGTTEADVERLLTAAGGMEAIRVESGQSSGGTGYVELSAADQADPFAASSADTQLSDLDTFGRVIVGEAAITAFVNMSTVWDYIAAQSPGTDTYRNITAAGLAWELGDEGENLNSLRLRVAFAGE